MQADRKLLLRALDLAAKIVPKRTPKEILKSVRLSAADGILMIHGTNYESSVTVTVPCEGDLPPSLAKLAFLRDFAKVHESTEGIPVDSVLDVSTDVQLFPEPVTPPKPGEVLKLSTGRLLDMLQFAAVAGHLDESRYAIVGVLMSIKKGPDGPVFRCTAVDGYRIATVENPIDAAGEWASIEALVPIEIVDAVVKMLKSYRGMVHVRLDDLRASFSVLVDVDSTAAITTQLLAKTFPDYHGVMPKGWNYRATCKRTALIEAIEKCTPFVGAAEHYADFTFDALRGAIDVEIWNPETGEGAASLPARIEVRQQKKPKLSDMGKVKLNPFFVLDALKNCDAVEIEFQQSGWALPTLFLCGSGFVYALMPISEH